MTLDDTVRDVLTRYRDDEVMLDALVQWASLGILATEGDYRYVAANLRERHGLPASTAAEYTVRLAAEVGRILQDGDAWTAGGLALKQLEGHLGEEWRRGVSRRLAGAGADTTRVVRLAAMASALGDREKEWLKAEGPLLARFFAAHGSLPPPMRARLTEVGLLNRVSWASNAFRDYLVEHALWRAIAFPDDDQAGRPDAAEYVRMLSAEGRYEQLRILDEVSREHGGVRYYPLSDDLRRQMPDTVGIFGTYQHWLAISPFVLDDVREALSAKRGQCTVELRLAIERALVDWQQARWPNVEPNPLIGEGQLWGLDLPAQGKIYFLLAPWLTAHEVSPLGGQVVFADAPSLVAIVPFQAAESVKAALQPYQRYQESSVVLVSSDGHAWQSELLSGRERPLLSEVLGVLAKELTPSEN